MNTPNKLTILRMILVPFFLVTLTVSFPHNYLVALIIFSAASLTDGVYSAGGIATSGKIAVVIAAVVLLVISFMNIAKKERN